MRKIVFVVLAAASFLVLGSKSAFAQPGAPAVELSGTEFYEFRTSEDTVYELYVALPSAYELDGDAEYPVLYLTDGKISFPLVLQIYKLMVLGDELPPMILVGIDRPTKSMPELLASRMLDLTPTEVPEVNEEYSKLFGHEVQSGGAEAFLSVLENEIIPWVETRYAASDERGLSGFSLSGLFTAYVLFTSPNLFTSYLIVSPSVWWDDESIFELEEGYASEHRDLAARVFLSVGTREGAMMLPNIAKMTETLASRGYGSLELQQHILQDETHLSSIAGAFSRGLVYLFGPQ